MKCHREKYKVDHLKALYDRYSRIPIPVKVFLELENCPSPQLPPNLVRVHWQYRDVVQQKTVKYQKNYLPTGDGRKFMNLNGLSEELPANVTLEAISKNANRRVILKSSRSNAAGKNPKQAQQYLVVYDHQRVRCLSVKALHDDLTILDQANFSPTFTLNDDGSLLLCVVQLNEHQPKNGSGAEANPSSNDYILDRHQYRDSWGEQLSTIYHSSIALIHLELEKLVLIDKRGLSLREPFFFKVGGESGEPQESQQLNVGCIGLQELPHKLGLAFCTNRTSFLLVAKVSFESIDFSPPLEPEVVYGDSGSLALSSPRVFQSTESKVLFLERDSGGAHNKSARLVRFDFDSRKVDIILDNTTPRQLLQQKYSQIGPLFTDALPENCFTVDGRAIILHSTIPTSSNAFFVDLERKEMKVFPFPHGSCQILGLTKNWLVAVGSALNSTPNVYLCNIPSENVSFLESPPTWLAIESEESKQLANMYYETFAFPSRHFPDKLVNCIWSSPSPELSSSEDAPTVVIPHGGPHSSFTIAYNRSVALFTELGLKTCLINYLGSLGIDEEYVRALLGRVGTSDVHDVLDTIAYLRKVKSAKKIILYGGSHGGFLVTRLSAQYPELGILGCIARNPGIDVLSKTVTGDIPDWTAAEIFGCSTLSPYTSLYPRTEKEVAAMYAFSVTPFFGQAKVPTLLLLGREDRRVPASQGLYLARILKASRVETRVLVYDDSHSLAKVTVDYDSFLNIGLFLRKHLFGE